MIPDTGPRWYETPLWFVAWLAVYAVAVALLGMVLPHDLRSPARTVLSAGLLVATFVSSVAIRGRLRRRDA